MESGLDILIIKLDNQGNEIWTEIIGKDQFAEIYLSAPLEVCKQRDTSGLYDLAEKGQIAYLSGVSAPYETPTTPALIVPTHEFSLGECVELIAGKLVLGTA